MMMMSHDAVRQLLWSSSSSSPVTPLVPMSRMKNYLPPSHWEEEEDCIIGQQQRACKVDLCGICGGPGGGGGDTPQLKEGEMRVISQLIRSSFSSSCLPLCSSCVGALRGGILRLKSQIDGLQGRLDSAISCLKFLMEQRERKLPELKKGPVEPEDGVLIIRPPPFVQVKTEHEEDLCPSIDFLHPPNEDSISTLHPSSRKQFEFVQLLYKFPILLSKSQLPRVKKAKALAAKKLLSQLSILEGEKSSQAPMTVSQLYKKIQNMKTRVKSKKYKMEDLVEWEERFLSLIMTSTNFKVKKLPGPVSSTQEKDPDVNDHTHSLPQEEEAIIPTFSSDQVEELTSFDLDDDANARLFPSASVVEAEDVSNLERGGNQEDDMMEDQEEESSEIWELSLGLPSAIINQDDDGNYEDESIIFEDPPNPEPSFVDEQRPPLGTEESNDVPDDDEEEDDQDTSTRAKQQLQFVHLLSKFPILLSKSQLPSVTKPKAQAGSDMLAELSSSTITTLAQLHKKISNMRATVKEKKKASLKKGKKLAKWEEDFLKLMGEPEPKFPPPPGASCEVEDVGSSSRPGLRPRKENHNAIWKLDLAKTDSDHDHHDDRILDDSADSTSDEEFEGSSEEESEAEPETSTSGQKQIQFVQILSNYPILLNKSCFPKILKAKNEAALAMLTEVSQTDWHRILTTASQIQKKISVMKRTVKKRLSKGETPKAWEKKFLHLMTTCNAQDHSIRLQYSSAALRIDDDDVAKSESREELALLKKQLAFVQLLEKFPILLSKSQVPPVKKAKKKAVLHILAQLSSSGEILTQAQLLKKISNMKFSVQEKLGKSRKFAKWEERFLKLMGLEIPIPPTKSPKGSDDDDEDTSSEMIVDKAVVDSEESKKLEFTPEMQTQFVQLLTQFSAILSRSQVPEATKAKKKAIKGMLAELSSSHGIFMSEAQLLKKISNMKAKAKVALKLKTRTLLTQWEVDLIQLINPGAPALPQKDNIGPSSERSICELCGKTLKTPAFLAKHISIVHQNIGSHACPQCGKAFASKHQLAYHLDTHRSNEDRLKCSECGETFPTIIATTIHEQTTHGTKKARLFMCDKCPKTFLLRNMMLRHALVHTDVKAYVCKECGMQYRTQTSLRFHTKSRCGTDQDALMKMREWRNAHDAKYRAKLRFKCPVCKQGFPRRPGLVRHLKNTACGGGKK